MPRSKKDNLVGKKLGDYKLTQKLTSGGMSHVYIGMDEKLERKAAIKILTPDLQEADEMITERFLREAKAIAALEHDNIITIYQFGEGEESDGLYFIAMRFVDGHDLADELLAHRRRGERMGINRALRILEQTAAALDFAHEHGVIHRDIKPSNILLDKNDKAWLSDFGLVLRRSVDQTMGTAFGTPRYISPEQATDSTLSVPQSDIYSLGVVVYEILTGQSVFDGTTPMEMALSHITEAPRPPREINPEIPKEVEREVLKALEKAPEKRHKTATEFIQAIRKAYSMGGAIQDTQPDNQGAVPVQAGAAAGATPTPIIAEEEIRQTIDEVQQKKAKEKLLEDSPTNVIRPPEPKRRRGRRVFRELALVGIALGVLAILVMIQRGDNLPFGLELNLPGTDVVANVEPADTPDSVSGNVVDDDPTDEPIAAETSEPTDDPTATSTDAPPTSTPTDEPPTATDTLEPVVAGEPVSLVLQYTDLTFAFKNTTITTLDLSAVRFVPQGETRALELSGDDLPNTQLAPGDCLVVISSSPGVEVPEVWGCDTSQNKIIRETSALFWRSVPFDVVLNDETLESCEGVVRGQEEGTCALSWPVN